jgi:hypothetical protein
MIPGVDEKPELSHAAFDPAALAQWIAERTGPVPRFEKVEPGTSRSCPSRARALRDLLHGHEGRSVTHACD